MVKNVKNRRVFRAKLIKKCIFLLINLIVIFGYSGITFSDEKKEIKIIPVSLKEGFEGRQKHYGTLDKPESYGFNKLFCTWHKIASQTGVNLSDSLYKYVESGFNGKRFFYIFFNWIKTVNCDYKYLIQRIKITKNIYNDAGREVGRPQISYLVEVFKLDNKGEMKNYDMHSRDYFLGKAYQRRNKIECEVGWGYIPGQVEGKKWPYARNILYYLLQDYSEKSGLYDKIIYDFSKKYEISFDFGKNGYHVQYPVFSEPMQEDTEENKLKNPYKLTGIAVASNKQFAIIGKKFYYLNDEINGGQLIAIHPQRIIIKYPDSELSYETGSIIERCE